MKSLRNPERKPTHPGAVLREDVLPELGWTQTELANRVMLSNTRGVVSPGRALCSGRRARRFESSHPDQGSSH